MSRVEFGGEMIDFVYEQSASWKELPWKFEAGTPNMAGAIGLLQQWIIWKDWYGCHWISWTGIDCIRLSKLQEIEGLTIYGSQDLAKRSGVTAFNLGWCHPHDLATALDYEGVAVRAGHHCAQPSLQYLEVPATARASFISTIPKADCDKLVDALQKDKEFSMAL